MAISSQTYHLNPDMEAQIGFSQAVKVGDTLYVSGTVSLGPEGNVLGVDDMSEQIKNIYGTLEKTLAHHGMTFKNVVKETIFTIDIEKLIESISIRNKFFLGFESPAASWVEVSRLGLKELLLEVEIVAVDF